MTKYIPLDTLIAEIERRMEERDNSRDEAIWNNEFWSETEYSYRSIEDEAIIDLINTLEVKEVNLENIAAVEWDNSIRKINGDPDNAYFLINRNDYIELTKHLFKLILKAQKGE